ncbi:tetratricopeptide (TPR) repeat protein [Caldalkalibacillus uzonensis]|uniref:Tetratricopeptide (TPR) repeat protein n=1 Tax=Caldalkalibacillus uzonensis TaxID=353224 RepID=A0ABU0CRH4_9BACI|nr:tetratricopeptide repeat protein [Caldalkalibacillus uzonensis]MDQ0337622.1 tetratricopeptide (TPR) repeat protein [Caldalkalibacillus uzonensis]
MEIKTYFEQLHKRLMDLSHQYAKGLVPKEVYEDELAALQKESELILEEWIKFEEALSQIDFVPGGTDNMMHGQPGTVPLNSAVTQSSAWKQAKAFYDLMMFEQAIPHFCHVVGKHPDFEQARLFLAHAYLATNQLEKAKYHLQFLLDTTQKDDLYHLAAHGLACLQGTLKAYEQAHYYFEKINLEQVRDEWKGIITFNHAQTLYQLQWYTQSLEKFKTYVALEPHDWRGPYMIGQVYLQLGDEEAGLAYWFEAMQMEENPELLKRMAKHFEQKAMYQMAIQCYQRILKHNEKCLDPEVWAGLAWNYGLVRDMEHSQPLFIKALSLFPQELDIQLSYTWMLLFWNRKQKAQEAISRLEQLAHAHPLVEGLRELYNGQYPQVVDTVAYQHLSQEDE